MSSVLRVLFFFGLGALLLWLVLHNLDFHVIADNIRRANLGFALLSLVFGFVSNINRSARWNMLLKPLGYKPKFINTFNAVIVGYFANLGLPRMGEVTRCAVLNRYEHVPMDKSLGTVFTERVIDVLTLLVCMGIVVVLEFTRIGNVMHTYIVQPFGNKMNAMASGSRMFYLLAFVLLLMLVGAAYAAWKYFRGSKFYNRLMNVLRGFGQGIQSVRRIDNLPLFLFHTVSMWVMYWMMAYSCLFCFDFTRGLSLLVGFVINTLGAFGFAAPAPGGVGVYHYIVAQTLTSYGLAYKDGMSYAVLAWTTQTAAVIVFGCVALIVLPLTNRKKSLSHEQPVATVTK